MLHTIAALQPLLIGGVLLWSGSLKLFSRFAAAEARRTALPGLVGENRAVGAYKALGVLELLIAAALIAPPPLWIEPAAGAALSAGFLGYLAYAKVAAPTSSCGCMGAQPSRVGRRAFARAGVLLAASAAALAWAPSTAWYTSAADAPVVFAAVLAAEALLVAGFSSELDHRWLLPLRRLHNRLTHPLAGGGFEIPLDSTVTQLIRSGVYRHTAAALHSDLGEHWDEGEWRFLVYSARWDGRPATAVYAVPRLRYAPDDVRLAIVDEERGETLLTLDSPPEEATEARPEWVLTTTVPEHVRTA
ncbi:MauE/DoxX family redox-associated membrane protein [Phytomonospora sp. NPDC050363]|uniref:MauE/DoxX family redox-associated membrane protein n=1 Tax=Phytomonospora sp. NPDC050363 TaxID=3155642 RepID=UPI0033EC779A